MKISLISEMRYKDEQEKQAKEKRNQSMTLKEFYADLVKHYPEFLIEKYSPAIIHKRDNGWFYIRTKQKKSYEYNTKTHILVCLDMKDRGVYKSKL